MGQWTLAGENLADTMPRPKGPTMTKEFEGDLVAREIRIAMVISRFNDYLTSHMRDAAVARYRQLGGNVEKLDIAHVPGSLELAVTAKSMAETGRYDVIVCLGCVIRGETDHYDHVVEQTARGLQEVGTRTGVPCISGVVTAETLEQAINRAGAKMGNQGATAMMAGIEMANLIKKVGHPRGKA